ncbi:heavy metal translocating P-type ATPase [Salibaculum griseiflavum]|uniref:Heavy metal translocating P-type ATPase n=1 Tax=Salibaculum griseiflavum TaxID=1914409 RepID=A0A2V1P4S6_9RHOB|nr:heavy metal translocating P-type ATPase [Salibaculum griseiflavum]PWG16788.1 heavy metal translocating P-type ATPase [Salibaculum griseiflavum]
MTVQRLDFEIDGLSCAGCVGRAERAISSVSGVTGAEVNLATRSARVALDGPNARGVSEAINGALKAAGYPAVPHRLRLRIEGMTCASCVARVEDALSQVPGVTAVTVNLADGVASVTTLDKDTAPLIAAVKSVGYDATRLETGDSADEKTDREIRQLRRSFILAAVLTLPIFVVEMGSHAVPAIHHFIANTIGMQDSWMIQFVLATLVLAGPGRMFFAKGFPALWRRAPDMNSLVAIGAGAAWAYSSVATFRPQWLPDGTVAVYFEAAAVIVTLILLGRWLEARAKGRTSAAIKRLVSLRPDTARVEREGEIREVAVDDIKRGDRIHLRPGDRIPVDGVVREGSSFVDESMVTGEPVAVEKTKGAALVAGTVNGNGALVMRATAVGADTMLARIIEMVEEAQGSRLPVQDLVNRITSWFVPAVMGVALVTIAFWLIFGPEPALPFALVSGVSVLIIACPCAMGLATPMSIMVGTGRAADLGVLFRRGDALQSLQSVDVVAFDKTGTLTLGKPQVTDITCEGDEADFLSIVAAVEAASDHPLAGAIVAEAKARGLDLPQASAVQAVPGHGLSGVVDDRKVAIGNARMMNEADVDAAELIAQAERLAEQGRTIVLVAIDGKPAGLLGLADTLKPAAKATIDALHARGVQTALISGDSEPAARAIASELGIDHVVAGVLPDGKVDAVRALQEGGRKLAFVGDGINDAPALAAADIGIAMGSGTDVAVESADVVLVSGNPGGVAEAVEISRRTLRNIWQNLGWAFGYNVLLIPVAAGLLYVFGGPLLSPQLAAGAMALSSVLVVTNALRLRRVKTEALS